MFIKKKDFEELKNRVEKLEDKIAVAEFEKENPNGIKIDIVGKNTILCFTCEYCVKYVKGGKVKTLSLGKWNLYDYWEILEDNIIKKRTKFMGAEWETFYELDKGNDTLVEVRFKEKPTTKKGSKK